MKNKTAHILISFEIDEEWWTDNTGDATPFTRQGIRELLRERGVDGVFELSPEEVQITMEEE
jgi:hypothetical protein